MTATFTSIVEPLPSTVPFVGPEHQERQRGIPFKARIGANESVFGPSPAAVEAMHRAAPEAWMYCDPNMHDLRMAIAAHHSIDPASIVIGEGIDGLFGYTNRLFVERGDKVVTSLGAYPTFNFHVAGYGGELITVPFVEDHEDPDSLISAAERHRPKLIYMSNPDNPMGTWHSADTISTMIERVPEGSLLCLDEAYIEFAPDGTAPALDTTDKRVIRFRTFSKAYGMAGMRIAYAITHPDIALAFDRIRNHFGVSRIAQEAAIAALKDAEHLARVVRKVTTARQRIADIATANGLTTLSSATNFVAMDCGQNGDFARRVLGGLLERDIFVRMPGVAPQDRCIRIGAGREEDMNLLSKELPKALSEAELS
jgi:histidinol-phosphate aminotransferase